MPNAARRVPMLLLAVAFPACAAPWPREPQIELLPGPIVLYSDESRADYRWAGRVVDALTGEPIPGAVLYQVPERNRPEGGRFWCDGQWRADRDGFVRVPQAETTHASWFIVEARGHGPVAEMHCPPEEVVRLLPGIDVPVVVQDWSGRPVGSAEVGFCLGCGHTPDLRVATTDAAGRAWIRGITSCHFQEASNGTSIRDLYVRHADLGGCYEDVSWRLGDPAELRRQIHVADVVGRITAPGGKPLACVAVGGSLHRGPWTWTDGDGRFRHSGRESAGDELQLVLGDHVWYWRLPAWPQPLDIVLPPPASLAERSTGSLLVTVRDGATGEFLEDAAVHAKLLGLALGGDNQFDGGGTDVRGEYRLSLVAGRVEVVIEGPGGRFEPEVRQLDLPADRETPLVVDLERRPLVAVTLEGWHEPQVSLVTQFAEYATWLTPPPDGPAFLPLPARGPFVLVCEGADPSNERRFRFEALPDGPLLLRPFAPTHVRGRVVDENGGPLQARVALAEQPDIDDVDEGDWLTTAPDGAFDLRTVLIGCTFLLVQPVESGHRPRVMHLSLPERGDDRTVEPGDVVLRATAAPRLCVLRRDGTPATGRISLERPGLGAAGELAMDGGFDGLDPMPGDRVTVRIEEEEETRAPVHCVPLAVQLEGQGPWTLRQGDCSLVIDVRDEHGQEPEGACVILRDRHYSFTGDNGRMQLLDVPAGRIELFVGAEALQSARVRLTLEPGEQRRVTVTLPHRQARSDG